MTKDWSFPSDLIYPVVLIGTLLFILTTWAQCIDKQCLLPEGCPNKITEPVYQNNPYFYEAVNSVAEATNVDGNLNLRVNPLGTYMLYDETVLLCSLPFEKFQGIDTPFLMVYRRVARRSVKGVGCHELVDVWELNKMQKLTP